MPQKNLSVLKKIDNCNGSLRGNRNEWEGVNLEVVRIRSNATKCKPGKFHLRNEWEGLLWDMMRIRSNTTN